MARTSFLSVKQLSCPESGRSYRTASAVLQVCHRPMALVVAATQVAQMQEERVHQEAVDREARAQLRTQQRAKELVRLQCRQEQSGLYFACWRVWSLEAIPPNQHLMPST